MRSATGSRLRQVSGSLGMAPLLRGPACRVQVSYPISRALTRADTTSMIATVARISRMMNETWSQ
jgi:hypothetical protein